MEAIKATAQCQAGANDEQEEQFKMELEKPDEETLRYVPLENEPGKVSGKMGSVVMVCCHIFAIRSEFTR